MNVYLPQRTDTEVKGASSKDWHFRCLCLKWVQSQSWFLIPHCISDTIVFHKIATRNVQNKTNKPDNQYMLWRGENWKRRKQGQGDSVRPWRHKTTLPVPAAVPFQWPPRRCERKHVHAMRKHVNRRWGFIVLFTWAEICFKFCWTLWSDENSPRSGSELWPSQWYHRVEHLRKPMATCFFLAHSAR